MKEQINSIENLKPQSRQYIDEHNDEGIFWMPYEEFLRYFTEFYVCRAEAHQTKVFDGSFFINQSIKAFSFKVNQESRFDFQLYQSNQNAKMKIEIYPIISPVIVKLNNLTDSSNFDLVNHEHINFMSRKSICVNTILTPGDYLVLPIMFQNLFPKSNKQLNREIKDSKASPKEDTDKYKLVIQNSLKNKGSFEIRGEKHFNMKYFKNILFELCKQMTTKSEETKEFKESNDSTVSGEFFVFKSVHKNLILVTAHNKHPERYLKITTTITQKEYLEDEENDMQIDDIKTREPKNVITINWISSRKNKFKCVDTIPPMKKKVIALIMLKKKDQEEKDKEKNLPNVSSEGIFTDVNEPEANSNLDLHTPFD